MIDTNKQYTPPAKYKPTPFNPNKKPEKVPGFTVLSFFILMATYIGKYCLDFLLLPTLLPQVYAIPGLAIMLWIITTVIITFIAIKFISGFGLFYIPACLLYALCVLLWPNGAFGFGTVIPAALGATIAYVANRVIERIEMWIFMLVGFVTM